MTAETKLRTLAASDSILKSLLGTAPFRWFDVQEVPTFIKAGTCVRVRRVSTVHSYSMTGKKDISEPRFQIDVLDYSAEVARIVGAVIILWLGTIDLAAGYQFASPPTTPPQSPVFILNERTGIVPQLSPTVWVHSIDVRLFNLET